MFTPNDLSAFKAKNIALEQVISQLNDFRNGFPYLELTHSASVDKGILQLDESAEKGYMEAWENYLNENHDVLKFVPASGAASRMFKNLFEFLESGSETPSNDFEKKFFGEIHHFAFFKELNEACIKNTANTIDQLLEKGNYQSIVRLLLMPEGLNYGSLPKGLLCFHHYGNENRKAVVEHLVEGALYAKTQENLVNVHFTVSPEHRALFEAEVKASAPAVEKAFGVQLNIRFSEQKSNTDTVAANSENNPFRDQGEIVFRPGGHGALIENLNDLEGDVVFVKNIDNVVPDRLKDLTVRYKKIIAGVLVTRQQKIFDSIRLLESGKYDRTQLLEIIHFLQDELCTRNPNTKNLEDSELAIYLINKLNRPIRVCGMVRNQGEPGGGPFWAYNSDGTISLQILESTQIDLNDPNKKAMFEQGTHFNPVDLVCAIRNYRGEKFKLMDYVDPKTAFISHKSKNGKDLKALELPGLWNGAMSDWNTIFVEVPPLTFNPVKTVNDLLRPEHQ
ncbi:MAG TPA: DUF4301 family protein [Bacteroidales bacterium]|nr:DUF4301 family protein [Bacteroidales bacterium]